MTENDSCGDRSFQLESGRIVSLHAFHLSATYADVLEGDPLEGSIRYVASAALAKVNWESSAEDYDSMKF